MILVIAISALIGLTSAAMIRTLDALWLAVPAGMGVGVLTAAWNTRRDPWRSST